MPLEDSFDATFAARLALREKQIQQNYRPVIGVHKWFARRPGTLFRNLLLAEFDEVGNSEASFFHSHRFEGVIADPFMGGGTPLIEANRLGFHVLGTDINPMAYWIVRQEVGPFDDDAFSAIAERVAADVEREVGDLYKTACSRCGDEADVKYFLWVKKQECPACRTPNDLFPGYLLAEATRHPKHVLACSDCFSLVELDHQPTVEAPAQCPECGGRVRKEGPAKRNKVTCRGCREEFRYPAPDARVPEHRMWAIEYHCEHCKPNHKGRFFKSPDEEDLERERRAVAALEEMERAGNLSIPEDEIPLGDETKRLHKWGYPRYRDMFGARQLLGLGLLLRRIRRVSDAPVRHALLTVFSDFLRYQNMLCRYDTYALKCQDIFSVHGFPVGLVQCENNLLGIPGVGAGAFRHFVEKYRRAKAYCSEPFEKRRQGKRNVAVPITGESIEAEPVAGLPKGEHRQAVLLCAPATDVELSPESLDGVFTDPPYFDNVQYAELMDFCYMWLRKGLRAEFPEFARETTQSSQDLTGNKTLKRGLDHFTQGLSDTFMHYAKALKPGAPFVFTYHHNKIEAYAPLVVALLDAGLLCTAVLPAPGEMEASLHINGTGSSVLDSVFICRIPMENEKLVLPDEGEFDALLLENLRAVAEGGVKVSLGDARCLFSGHVARLCVRWLQEGWSLEEPLEDRLGRVTDKLKALADRYGSGDTATRLIDVVKTDAKDQMPLFGPEEVAGAASV